MDWLKKKKEEAKQAASQAAAKLQNKRTTAFKGEGNVLGGGDGGDGGSGNAEEGGSSSNSGGGNNGSAARLASAPAAASSTSSSSSRAFKVPGFGKTASEPPPTLSEDEKRQRREAQLKALDGRTNAWDKRVATARKARLQQEAEREAAFGEQQVSNATSDASAAEATATSASTASGPAPRVLSADEMRAFELERAQALVGFNPYAAVISSSSEASSVMQAIGGGASDSSSSSTLPPPAPSAVASVRSPQASASSASSEPQAAHTTATRDASHSNALDTSSDIHGNGAVYVLLRQEPVHAIAAAETIIKMLRNVLKSPQDDKFRSIRVANAAIQSKVVAVRGAVELLTEAGFAPLEIDSEQFLVLAADAFDAARVQAALDRTEVALIQLQVDATGI